METEELRPTHIYDRLVTLGEAWAEAHYAAELLEETKKTVLAKFYASANEATHGAKESAAMRHPDYQEHIEKMVAARYHANRAKVKYDSARIWAELMRTKSANDRAAMREAV